MNRIVYNILQATWGCVMNILGFLTYFIFCILGLNTSNPDKSIGYAHDCVVPFIGNCGFTLGAFIFRGENTDSIKSHEYGHTIQNAIFGPLMPFLVSIPSVIRFWYRELKYYRKNKKPSTNYDDAWFEG